MKKRIRKDPRRIDLGLEILARLQRPGQVIECADIAEICDCHRDYIHKLYNSAMDKLRRRAPRHALAGYLDDHEPKHNHR